MRACVRGAEKGWSSYELPQSCASRLRNLRLCHVSAPLLHLVLVNIPVLGLRKMSRFVLLLAASATALNLGVPVLRSTRPSLRRVRTGRFAQAPCCLTRTAT